ncbi:MAG: M24 family metallopeptidase [Omnitrophica WOR_2 bacterium]
MNQYNLDRLKAYLSRQQISTALLTHPHTITWLTGYAPPVQTGPSPFEGSPVLALWQDGQLTLIVSDMEAGAGRNAGAEEINYLSYTIQAPIAGFANQAQALEKALAGMGAYKGSFGLEYHWLPASLLGVIQKTLPAAAFISLDGAFDLDRAIKSPEEVQRIRAALELADLAQEETRKLLEPGKSEIEIWGAVKARLEIQAGKRLTVLADFVAGPRTAEIGGLPGTYVLKEGDALIADIVPRLDGYWGDNAGTHFAGEPPAELRKMYHIVLETLQKGIQAVKPGVRACELDSLLREAIRLQGYPAYPHHSGHGLGASYHEEPRLVPYNTLPLEPGMVVALEPGIYSPGVGGVRLEDVVLVNESGCELLTRHLEQAG